MNAKTKQKGFSLLEMLLVLAVLGILLGIGGYQLGSATRTQRLNEATRMLGDTLRQIGQDAAAQSQEFTVDDTSSASDKARLSWTNEDGDNRHIVLPHSATISAQVPSGDIDFSGRGFPRTGVSFTVTTLAGSRQVNLLPTGVVTY